MVSDPLRPRAWPPPQMTNGRALALVLAAGWRGEGWAEEWGWCREILLSPQALLYLLYLCHSTGPLWPFSVP